MCYLGNCWRENFDFAENCFRKSEGGSRGEGKWWVEWVETFFFLAIFVDRNFVKPLDFSISTGVENSEVARLTAVFSQGAHKKYLMSIPDLEMEKIGVGDIGFVGIGCVGIGLVFEVLVC